MKLVSLWKYDAGTTESFTYLEPFLSMGSSLLLELWHSFFGGYTPLPLQYFFSHPFFVKPPFFETFQTPQLNIKPILQQKFSGNTDSPTIFLTGLLLIQVKSDEKIADFKYFKTYLC